MITMIYAAKRVGFNYIRKLTKFIGWDKGLGMSYIDWKIFKRVTLLLFIHSSNGTYEEIKLYNISTFRVIVICFDGDVVTYFSGLHAC